MILLVLEKKKKHSKNIVVRIYTPSLYTYPDTRIFIRPVACLLYHHASQHHVAKFGLQLNILLNVISSVSPQWVQYQKYLLVVRTASLQCVSSFLEGFLCSRAATTLDQCRRPSLPPAPSLNNFSWAPPLILLQVRLSRKINESYRFHFPFQSIAMARLKNRTSIVIFTWCDCVLFSNE